MIELNVCNYLGIEPAQLPVCREEGDDVVAVVDRGIKGCPKYRIPMNKLLAVADEPVDELSDELAEKPADEPVDEPLNATDAAIKLAAESGVDLVACTGTGKGGTITVGDVRRAIDDAKCDGDGPDTD
jgi:pyruvate/2-oxoglutarate dehydrogenase complex dihydrolipoamide acyltransferase (E2) component